MDMWVIIAMYCVSFVSVVNCAIDDIPTPVCCMSVASIFSLCFGLFQCSGSLNIVVIMSVIGVVKSLISM